MYGPKVVSTQICEKYIYMWYKIKYWFAFIIVEILFILGLTNDFVGYART